MQCFLRTIAPCSYSPSRGMVWTAAGGYFRLTILEALPGRSLLLRTVGTKNKYHGGRTIGTSETATTGKLT